MWYRNLQHADLPYPTVGEGWVIHNGEWMLQSMLRGTPTSRPFRHGDSVRNVSGPYTPMTPQQMGLTTPPPTPPEEEIGGEEGLQRLVQTLGFKLYAPKFHVPRHPGMARAYGVAGRRVAVAGRRWSVGSGRSRAVRDLVEGLEGEIIEEVGEQVLRSGAPVRRILDQLSEITSEISEEASEALGRAVSRSARLAQDGSVEAAEALSSELRNIIRRTGASGAAIETAVEQFARTSGRLVPALVEGTTQAGTDVVRRARLHRRFRWVFKAAMYGGGLAAFEGYTGFFAAAAEFLRGQRLTPQQYTALARGVCAILTDPTVPADVKRDTYQGIKDEFPNAPLGSFEEATQRTREDCLKVLQSGVPDEGLLEGIGEGLGKILIPVVGLFLLYKFL